MPLLVLSPQRVIKMTKRAGIVFTFLAIIVMAGCAVTSEAKRDAARRRFPFRHPAQRLARRVRWSS